MTLPRYIANNELEIIDPVTNKPVVVVRKEPVRAEAPNRGTFALSDALDSLQMHSRIQQTLHFRTTPTMKWTAASRRWALSSGPLTLGYVLDYPGTDTPVVRETTLLPGNYVFPAGRRIMLVPLGLTGNVTLGPNSGVTGPVPAPVVPPGGSPPFYYLANHAELAQQLRNLSVDGRDASLRYIVLAQTSGTALVIKGTHVLRDGVEVVQGYQDSEYQGTEVFNELRGKINRDRNVLVLGGGEVSCSPSGASSMFVQTSLPLRVVSPRGVVHSVPGLQTGVTLTPATPNLVIDLSTTGGPATPAATPQVVADSAIQQDQLQRLLLARLDSASGQRRVIWRDGSVYAPNEAYPLGMRPFRTSAEIAADIVPFYVYDDAGDVVSDPDISPGDRRIVAVRGGNNVTDPRIRFSSREILDEDLAVREILEVGGIDATGDSEIAGNLGIGGDLQVTGQASADVLVADTVLADEVFVGQDVEIGGDLTVDGDTLLRGLVQTEGDVTLGSPGDALELRVHGTIQTVGLADSISSATVSGLLLQGLQLQIGTPANPVPLGDAGIQGNLVVDGALSSGPLSASSVSSSGAASVGGALDVSGTTTVQGLIRAERVSSRLNPVLLLRANVGPPASAVPPNGLLTAIAASQVPGIGSLLEKVGTGTYHLTLLRTSAASVSLAQFQNFNNWFFSVQTQNISGSSVQAVTELEEITTVSEGIRQTVLVRETHPTPGDPIDVSRLFIAAYFMLPYNV